MSVVIETTIGDITVDLFIQDRPQICKNFLKLCSIKYYNHCSFHYVQRDFIAQTGDPTGSGNGGESVYTQVHGASGRFIQTERKPKIKHDRAGLISMVNNGENLHGSQFFFTLSHTLDYLDNVHSVFGEVVEGQDVIVKLNEIISDENNRPYQDILITHTVVLDDPYPPIEGLTLPSSSPEYNFEDLLKTERIGVGEELFDVDKPPEVLEEEIRDKEAKQRALVLEMIGDLPDADAAPPENVLFICKLNPITAEEDLEIIFSRFGKIVSCEIIKDEVSGDSLQYGFIEFDCKENCEKAYFKMDNVLIDDRRIHVDFSQSVSKMKWKGKGRIEYQDDKGNWSKAKQRYNDRPQHHQKSHPHQNNPMRSNRQRQRSRSPPPPPPPGPPTDKRRHRSRTPEKHRRRSPSPDRRRSRRSRSPESNRNRRDRSRSRDRDRRRDRDNDGHARGDYHASSRHHQKRHDREEYSRDQDRSRRRSRSSERHHRARN